MTSNILTKASNRLSHIIESAPLTQWWTAYRGRLSDAMEAFRFTYERGKIPTLGPESEMDWATAEKEADSEGNLEQTSLVPTEFAHFSDGVPLTEASFMEWKKLKPEQRVHRNSKQLQASVLRWENLAYKPIPTATRIPELKVYYIVFMHIPKAGGTTLQNILSKNYLPNQCIHANAPEIVRNPAVLFNMRRKQPRPVIMGHFDRAGLVYEFLGDRPIIHFTMFRDPVKRVLSHYNYLRTRRGHSKHSQVKDLSLEEYLSSPIREVCNKQTLRILGYSSEEALERSLTDPEPLLEEAKQVLEQEFTFFGFTERYTEFLLMARKLLGWQDIVYQQRNLSSRDDTSKQIIESTAIRKDDIQMIRDRNQLDIQLYEFANELFSKRCEILGIDANTVAKYDQVSQNYQTVLADLRAVQ